MYPSCVKAKQFKSSRLPDPVSIKHPRSSRMQTLRQELSHWYLLWGTYTEWWEDLKQGTKPWNTTCCPVLVSQEDIRQPGMAVLVRTFSGNYASSPQQDRKGMFAGLLLSSPGEWIFHPSWSSPDPLAAAQAARTHCLLCALPFTWQWSHTIKRGPDVELEVPCWPRVERPNWLGNLWFGFSLRQGFSV